MVSKNNNPDWLPPGWKLQIKVKDYRKIKVYVHSKTHQKLYSKPAVLRHLKDESSSNGKSQLKNECSSNDKSQSKNENNSQLTPVHAKNTPAKQEMQLVVANDSHQWLPSGWSVEIRTRKSGAREGTEYKCFVDPSSGSKFFSKPEVFRYLKSVEGDKGSSGGEKRRSARHSSDNRSVDKLTTENCNVEPTAEQCNMEPNVSQSSILRARKNHSSGGKEILVENTVDEDLPSGWIKEIRKRLLGDKVVRKDPLYFHPGSGLVFRSKQEVLCYLDTGEISRHAYRRRSEHPGGEELAAQEISPPSLVKSEKSTSYGARKEHTCKGVLSLVPEAGVRRITRSSSNCKAASGGESSPLQLSLQETANNSHEVLPSRLLIKMESATEDAIGTTKVVSQNIQNGDGKQTDASMMEMEQPSVSSRDIVKVKNAGEIAMRCSNVKLQSSKRKMKDQKLPSVPLRSSKRLAGVNAEVVFHSTPIEYAVRAPSRNSNGTKPIHSLGSSSNSLQEKHISPDSLQGNRRSSDVTLTHSVPALQEAMRQTLEVNTQPVLATEEERSSCDSTMQRVKHVVDLEVHPPPGSSKSSVSEAQTSNTDQLSETLKDRVRESHTRQMQFPRGRPIVEGQSISLPGSKIEQTSTSQPLGKEQPARLVMDTVQLASEFSTPSQSTTVKLPMNPPPPFLGGRLDKLPESKTEPSSTGRPATDEPQASTGRDTEQPASEFSFPSPLWSDPCLEFAYKTLTGAIPLDDNLAIEDYIQHQLRTSKQGDDFQSLPDVDAPSFFQNDETKLVPSAPEGVRFPNGNGSHKTIR